MVALVAEGLANPQIAESIFISPGTIKTELAHVFKKLDIHSRAELSARAAARRNVAGLTLTSRIIVGSSEYPIWQMFAAIAGDGPVEAHNSMWSVLCRGSEERANGPRRTPRAEPAWRRRHVS